MNAAGQGRARSRAADRAGPDSDSGEDAELTLRAVVAGLAIGVLLCFTNMYFGLQSGWISMMSAQASILGFAVFKVVPHTSWLVGSGAARRPLTVHENIVLQTTAVATGTLPLAAGFVGIIPALATLRPELDGGAEPIQLGFTSLLLWSAAVAFFGVFLAVPLRRQVIVKEQLVFPSGTATAQLISVLHNQPMPGQQSASKQNGQYRALSSSDESTLEREQPQHSVPASQIDQKAWKALLMSFLASAGYTLVSLAFPVIYAIPLFNVFGNLAHDWLWWFTPSFSYIGQGEYLSYRHDEIPDDLVERTGIIMGLPTTASMNLGMLCGWAFLSPLAKRSGWAPGPVSSSVDGSRGWILWPALAVMMAESILSISVVAISQLSGPLGLRKKVTDESGTLERRLSVDSEVEDNVRVAPRSDEEADRNVVIGGVVLSSVACVLLVALVFGQEGIKWWATVIALVLASIFSILGVRALGETDLNPVSAIGKISQLLFAVVQPGNIVANLIAGGISEAGAQQAGDLMQDLKTGHLHGASPKAQFHGQLIGSLASVFVSSCIFVLYRRAYELPSTSFPVPTAAVWLNLARLVNNGTLPPRTKEAMLVFGFGFVVLASLKVIGSTSSRHSLRWTRFIPSGIAFAIGFINTPSFSLARLIGGLVSYFVMARSRNNHTHTSASSHLENIPLIIVASGFVLGEGDTITTPVEELFEVMKNASRGDDVYGEDSATNEFQVKMAKMTGKEDAMFAVSGTMTNQIAIRTHLKQPPHSIILDSRSHVLLYEQSGVAFFSQANTFGIPPANGHHLTLEEVVNNAILGDDIHSAPTKVICLENTLSGMVFPQDEIIRISNWARQHDIIMHCDGARIWEAAAKTGLSIEELCRPFDTMSLCLSKGLGAPIGSVLVGPKDFIKKAKWFRKSFGGGIRQCGGLVAAADYCVDRHFPLLGATHELAAYLARNLADLGVQLLLPTETNMLWIDPQSIGFSIFELAARAKTRGITLGSNRVVVHFQITRQAVDDLIDVVREMKTECEGREAKQIDLDQNQRFATGTYKETATEAMQCLGVFLIDPIGYRKAAKQRSNGDPE
ncbi:OPT super [Microbotryomycetes sp. JL201]|nr:OPT super [Microbotryomycetes sp. JL201]